MNYIKEIINGEDNKKEPSYHFEIDENGYNRRVKS